MIRADIVMPDEAGSVPDSIGFQRLLEQLKKHCGACNSVLKSPKKLCSNCHGIAYCNQTCQRTHWKRHKLDCKLWEKKQEEKEKTKDWTLEKFSRACHSWSSLYDTGSESFQSNFIWRIYGKLTKEEKSTFLARWKSTWPHTVHDFFTTENCRHFLPDPPLREMDSLLVSIVQEHRTQKELKVFVNSLITEYPGVLKVF